MLKITKITKITKTKRNSVVLLYTRFVVFVETNSHFLVKKQQKQLFLVNDRPKTCPFCRVDKENCNYIHTPKYNHTESTGQYIFYGKYAYKC